MIRVGARHLAQTRQSTGRMLILRAPWSPIIARLMPRSTRNVWRGVFTEGGLQSLMEGGPVESAISKPLPRWNHDVDYQVGNPVFTSRRVGMLTAPGRLDVTGGLPGSPGGRPAAPGRAYCTVQMSTAIKEKTVSLDPAVAEPDNSNTTDRAPQTNPWVLRRKVVTTCIDRWEERPQGLSFEVHYIDTGAEWSYSKRKTTPTILGIPGQPGDHEDLLPIVRELHDDGHRVIIANMPAYSYAQGITPEDNEFYMNSTADLTEFLLHFIGALGLTRLDLVVTHSAGSFPLLVLSTASEIIKSALILCTPSGHVPSRINRPLWVIKGLLTLWETSYCRPFMKWFLPKFNQMTSWLNTDDPHQLMNTAKFGANMNFELLRTIAMEIEIQRRLPMVYLASKNDKLVELNLSKEWAAKLGIPDEAYDVYDDNYNLVKKAVLPSDLYIKGVLLAKGGHYPQRREISLPILVKEAKDLLQYVLQNENSN